MSTKNNALVSIAAAALGVNVLANASPVCDSLLNDLSVTQFGVAEIDQKGRALVIVSVKVGAVTTVRPVADSLGNVKVFGDVGAAMVLSKRANMAVGAPVVFVKAVKAGSVGDPISALKSRYKGFKSEAAAALKQSALVAGKISAAAALGWDAAVGTPENDEYLDLVERGRSIDEWKSFSDAQVVALAASLTTAGIDPLTVV